MPLARCAAVQKADVRCMGHLVRRGSARNMLTGRIAAILRRSDMMSVVSEIS